MVLKATSSFFLVNIGVFSHGDILEVNDETGHKLVKQGLCEYVNEKTIEKEEQKTVNYEEMTVKELKELLEEKGLNSNGKKPELIKRLMGM